MDDKDLKIFLQRTLDIVASVVANNVRDYGIDYCTEKLNEIHRLKSDIQEAK